MHVKLERDATIKSGV